MGSKRQINTLLTDKQLAEEGLSSIRNIENPFNLTDKDKDTLDKILAGNRHMYALYISENGHISQNKYIYEGGFDELKEYEGKYFTKMGQRPKQVFDNISKQVKSKYVTVPYASSFMVVNEYKNPSYKIDKIECSLDYAATTAKIENLLMELYKPGYIPTTKQKK